jgi:large subunit ribosomal protein L21
MFAVIKTGGKQYKVKAGDRIDIEKLEGAVGDKVSLEHVLMAGDGAKVKSGTPTIAGASVSGEIVEQYRNDKVIIFKKKRRHNYRRKKGHRQYLTAVKITGINA